MVTPYSDMTMRTVLTTQDTSWGRPHLSENRIDEIQMKARMQQRHHSIFRDIGDVSIVSFRGKEYAIKFLRDGNNSYCYKVNRMEAGTSCCPWVSQFFSGKFSGQVTRTLERQLNERHITPLSPTWFPTTHLAGLLSNQGMTSLARQVQADPHDGLKNLLQAQKKMQPCGPTVPNTPTISLPPHSVAAEDPLTLQAAAALKPGATSDTPSARNPPAVPPKPRVVAAEDPLTLQTAAVLQPGAASDTPSARNPPAVPPKPRVVAAEDPLTLQTASALQPGAASDTPSARNPPAVPPKPRVVAAEDPLTLQTASALQPGAASDTPSARNPPAVPPKPRVVAAENPLTLQTAAVLQPGAASDASSPRNPPAVPPKPNFIYHL
ncbi:hypothetical protein [Citrobacter braakii]|uniref:hypothetical protein n=1 Tax=Citrobacter braakii TaxID=57706 RepID=UPI00351D3B61